MANSLSSDPPQSDGSSQAIVLVGDDNPTAATTILDYFVDNDIQTLQAYPVAARCFGALT
jgi:hypothetical protein